MERVKCVRCGKIAEYFLGLFFCRDCIKKVKISKKPIKLLRGNFVLEERNGDKET